MKSWKVDSWIGKDKNCKCHTERSLGDGSSVTGAVAQVR